MQAVARGELSIIGDPVDLSSESYLAIWRSVFCFAESETEKALLSKLEDCEALWSNKEKPKQYGTLRDFCGKFSLDVDLIWKKSKLVYIEDVDIYERNKEELQNYGWRCVCGADAGLTVEHLLNCIVED